jgi:ribose 5-phosphate isomerase B
VKGARAAVVHDEITAQLCRSHNDANIICMSADLLGQRLIEKIAEIFLRSEFEGGRHARRVQKIVAIESGQNPASVRE